jgi:ATP-dependent Clp protease protease subunit
MAGCLPTTLQVHTVGVGVAIGQSCMLLSAGEKGKRFMLEHATAMLHQPRVPPTGQRQAIEIQIKWREVLAQKQNMLNILSRTTGHSAEKLDQARAALCCCRVVWGRCHGHCLGRML